MQREPSGPPSARAPDESSPQDGRTDEDEKPLTGEMLRTEAQRLARAALDALAALARGAASESVRASAANAILDRAYGKPLSGSKVEAEDEEPGVLEVRWVDS